jgi:hypothetical protein
MEPCQWLELGFQAVGKLALFFLVIHLKPSSFKTVFDGSLRKRLRTVTVWDSGLDAEFTGDLVKGNWSSGADKADGDFKWIHFRGWLVGWLAVVAG